MAGSGMAEEIGVFYITVTPTVNKNFGDDLEKQLNKSTGSMTGMFAKATALGGKMFSKIGKAGLGAITTVVGGLATLTAKGGFDRALNIERAQVKLKALGYNAGDVSNIMSSALTSVKGTAFGLGDAASTAATLIAGGVSKGEELTNILKTVGDTAQVSGRSFNDIGLIFSQVAAKGRLKGDDMLQLMSSGIPVLKLLADHFHTTTENAQDMVTKGKVSFKDFAAAMQEGLGGAALASGQSFDGAISNVKAALSRLGEKFETPAIAGLTKIFNALIPIIDKVSESLNGVAQGSGKQMGDWADKIVTILNRFSTGLNNGRISLDSIARSLATATSGFAFLSQGDHIGKFAITVAKSIGKAHTTAGNALEAMNKTVKEKRESFANLFKNGDWGLDKLEKVPERFQGIAGRMLEGINLIGAGKTKKVAQESFKSFGNDLYKKIDDLSKKMPGKWGKVFLGTNKALASGFGTLGSVAGKSASGFLNIVKVFLSPTSIMAAVGIGGIIAALIAGLGMIDASMQGQISTMISEFFAQLPQKLTEGTAFLQDMIPMWLQYGIDILTTIMQGITDNAPALIDSAVTILTTLVNALGSQLPTLVPIALNMVMALADGLLSNLPTIISSGLSLLLALAEGLMSALPQLIDKVPLIFSNLVDNIGAHLPEILSKGGQIIVTLGVGLINALPHIVSAMGSIMGKLIDVAKRTNWGDVGRNIIQGLIKGIQAMGGAFLEAIKNICADSLDAVKHFFGIKSPSRVMRDQVGKFIPLGMAVGIEQESDSVLDAMDSMMKIPSIVPSRYPELFTEFGAGKLNATMVNEWNTAQTGSKLDTLIGLQAAMYEDLGDIISQNVPSLSRRQAARI